MHSNVWLDLIAGIAGGALLFVIALTIMIGGRGVLGWLPG